MRRSHNAWDNPFTEKSMHTKNYHDSLQDECSDEDVDSNCRDEVVYNDDNLGGLLTLYKTRNKREVQDSTHSEQAHEKVPIRQAASSSTAKVTEEVTALKEAESYCRRATQFTGFEKQVEAKQLNNHDFDTGYNSGHHFTPCKQVDEEEVLPTPHISVVKRASESLDSLKVDSLVKDSWDRFVEEADPVEDVQCSIIEECEKKIPQSSSALKKSSGASRQKLRFSFRQGSKPHFLKGKEDPGQRQNVSVLEKLQSLVEEDVSLVDEMDCPMRKKSEKLAFSECMPIGERLQVLFSESSTLSRMNSVNKSSRKKQPISVPVVDRLMLALDEDNMPLKDTSNTHDEDSDVGDNPFVEECRGKKADHSLNERLQKALNDASECDEGYPIHGLSYRPIYGYAASLGRVLVQEKSRREKFLRALQTGHSLDDTAQSLEVQILTKTLEAYLATCTCKVCKAPQDWVNESRTLFQGELQYGLVTTIFNARTNPSLDLDIGNVIRIYPPWNEIGDLNDFGKIIICTYYCAMEDTAS